MWNGILPGVGWPSNLLYTEDDDGFFTETLESRDAEIFGAIRAGLLWKSSCPRCSKP